MLLSLTVNQAAQRCKYGGDTLRLIKDQSVVANPPFELKGWLLREQMPQRWLLQVAIGRLRKSGLRQRGLAHLPRPKNQDGGKLLPKLMETGFR